MPLVEPRRDLARAAARPRSDSSALRPGASPSQNGIDGGCAVRVLDAHRAALDPQDPVRGVAELEESPGRLSTAKSSFTVPTSCASRLEHHLVIGGVRDGAAGGDAR